MYLQPQLGSANAYRQGAPLARRHLRGLRRRMSLGGYLGALTPDAATQTAMPTSTISKTAGFTQAVYNDILASVQAGQITINLPSGCGSTPPQGGLNNLKLASTASGLALTGASVGASIAGASAAVAPFTLGISLAITGIVAIFSMILNHHAQAVAKEQAAECALVPAANNYLNIINQAVQNGTATPQQGIAALQSLLADFKSNINSIMKNNSSQCNAGCVIYKMLEAIVAYQTSVFQDMITQQTAAPASPTASVTGAVTSSIASAAAATGIPSWLFWLGGGFLVWKFL
jgi:hypothetical protein